jgi:hypothetical protein
LIGGPASVALVLELLYACSFLVGAGVIAAAWVSRLRDIERESSELACVTCTADDSRHDPGDGNLCRPPLHG